MKVLDLDTGTRGPLCTMILGDLGADVLKVERPGTGDETRELGTAVRRRRSQRLLSEHQPEQARHRRRFRRRGGPRLIERADRGGRRRRRQFRLGTLERRGISPATWCERRPELIWCTITGFGARRRRPGYDFVAQAECGWMAITGEPDGDPMKVGVALADILAGKDAAIAILGALVPKQRERRRAAASSSRSSTARSAALVNVAQNALLTGQRREAMGKRASEPRSLSTFQRGGSTDRDRGGNDAQWVACARALGFARSRTIRRCRTTPAASPSANESSPNSRARLRSKPAGAWRALLDAAGVPNGRVQSVLETLRDTNASALTGMPSSVGGSVRLAPPGLNQHGERIRELGWGAFDTIRS